MTRTKSCLCVAVAAIIHLSSIERSCAQTLLTDPSEQLFPGGAALKTNAEHERLLKRAEEYAAGGRLDLAAVLWQKVIDEAGDTLTPTRVLEATGPRTTPLVVYQSLVRHVEASLAKLPREALAAYRTLADPEARAVLAAARDDEEAALAEVVRRFFVSSVGDDAAYKLACLALDRHAFSDANRLLTQILRVHPDPSMSRAELEGRLAVAAAHLQDRQTAEASLAQLKAAGEAGLPVQTVELIAAHVQATLGTSISDAAPTSTEWPMAFGNSARHGQMPAVPDRAIAGPLAEAVSIELPLANLIPAPGRGSLSGTAAVDPLGAEATDAVNKVAAAREELIAQWRAAGWRPAGSLRFSGGRLYLRGPERLVCYPADARRDQPLWQSAWASHYELDALSQQLNLFAGAMGGGMPVTSTARPQTPLAIALFGDRVHWSLAIDGERVFCLEGARPIDREPAPSSERGQLWSAFPRRLRNNRLTAYHAASGKALWTRTAAGDRAGETADSGFLAAPTPVGELLLAPATDGGTLWLAALDRTSGRTIWQTQLCEEPRSGASAWAEPVLAADGQEAYVAAGCGIVFAVDASSGAIRWAVRYARDTRPNSALKNLFGDGAGGVSDPSGWDDDVVIPHGRLLVVMPSDSDRLLALDRRTGERVWESPRISPLGSVASYCLGVHGPSLFVAGKNVLRRFDLATGRLEHETATADSFGRGCLAGGAIYLPVNHSIVKYDLELQQVGSADVVLATDEPVGNLFSDGERFWVVGASRVYSLTSLESQLARLGERIAADDAEALLQRMRISMKLNRRDAALADLRGVFAVYRRQQSDDEAAQRVLTAMSQLSLPQNEPLVTLDLLTELLDPSRSPRLGQHPQAHLANVVIASITSLRQRKSAGAVSAILKASPLFSEDYLLNAAMLAVDAAAGEADVPELLAALESPSPSAQLVSLRAAARLAPEQTTPVLARLAKNSDDRVRLAAARALANLGQRRDVLETLIDLLDSPHVAVRTRSHLTLQALTGQQIPFAPEGAAADRAATARQWREWMVASGPSAPLRLPLADRAVTLGRTLVVSPSHLIELDAEHRERWRTRLPGAAWGCQGLPNGNRLVAINSHSMVIEYDESGREVWRKDRLPAPPSTVERLDSGHTLVACGHAQQLVEISPDGTTQTIPVPGHPVSAQRLDSSTTLVALAQPPRVVEVDRAGLVVWEARLGGHAPAHAVRLPSGNTLVTLAQPRQVVEFDPTGQSIVWRTEVSLIGPSAAQRLVSGETLVADQTGVRAIDASGRQVLWQFRQPQVTGLSSF